MMHLTTLARKFRATKFLKIIATQCIRDYPDKNCPTLLIYHNGQLKRQLVGVNQLGGMTVTAPGTVFSLIYFSIYIYIYIASYKPNVPLRFGMATEARRRRR